MPRVNIDDLYKKRVKELFPDISGSDTEERLAKLDKELNREWTPEEWYHELEKRWYFHNRSWYMFSEVKVMKDNYDPQQLPNISMVDDKRFCTPIHGCSKACFFYSDANVEKIDGGRLEYSKIQEAITGLNSFPGIEEARKELEKERMEIKQHIRYPASHPLFKLLQGQVFWIWNSRHLHLQEWLKTRGKCCFNHIVGEPEKWHAPMPLWD